MRLAPGWKGFVLVPLALGLLSLPLSPVTALVPAASVGLVLLAVLMAVFFRDPDREAGEGIVAAADGRVREAGRDGIVTFLNIHNVHVVRAPYAGRVADVQRFDGGHAPAFLESAGHNAGLVVSLQTAWGVQDVHLLAGLVARQSVAFVEPGDEVDKGERIGMIRFSSRVDIELPGGAEPVVEAGDSVRAGSSTLAKLPAREAEGVV